MAHVVWTATIFRILAVWLASSILVGLPGTLGGIVQMSRIEPVQPLSQMLPPVILPLVASALVIAFLWRWSDGLAERVWRDKPVPTGSLGGDHRALQQAVFIGFGVYLLVHGLPNLTELAAGYYTLPTGFGLETSYTGRLWARAIGVGLQMTVGIALILAASNVAGWLLRPDALGNGGADA